MTLHTKLLSRDDEQTTFARLVVRRIGGMPKMKEIGQRYDGPV
jgi:hypothetical protein